MRTQQGQRIHQCGQARMQPRRPSGDRWRQRDAPRMQVRLRKEAAQPTEFGGRGGKEPVRYGDWEVKGLAADF